MGRCCWAKITSKLLTIAFCIALSALVYYAIKQWKVPGDVCKDYDGSVESIRGCFSGKPIDHSKTFTVLLWTPQSSQFPPMDNKCGPCNITTDRAMAAESDALVFDSNHIGNLPDPSTRQQHQLYVWSCRESPWVMKKLHKVLLEEKYRFYFNATMTYRRSSAIDYSYLSHITRFPVDGPTPFLTFHHQAIAQILEGKRHLALFVSAACDHTHGARRRYEIITELIKAGLDIHAYGKCFGNSDKFPPFRSLEAVEVMSRYKFYISFENSYNCRDYITEKFWENAIYSGAVPIVWGPSRKDMEYHAPPNSFVFADDYSIKALVELIKRLDADSGDYMKYFDWRRRMEESEKGGDDSLVDRIPFYRKLLRNRTYGLCDLCRAMNTGRSKTFRPIPSLLDFWYETERPECLYGEKRIHTIASRLQFIRQQRIHFPLLELQPNHVTTNTILLNEDPRSEEDPDDDPYAPQKAIKGRWEI